MSAVRRQERPSRARRSAEGRIHASEQARGSHDATRPARGLSAERLLTAQQLADRWQVPKQHVYRLTRQGEIPVVRLGRYFRYRLDAIEAWEQGPEWGV